MAGSGQSAAITGFANVPWGTVCAGAERMQQAAAVDMHN